MNFEEEVMKLYRKWHSANELSERTGAGHDGVMIEEGVMAAFADLMYRLRKLRTPNGFDQRWLDVINQALEDRNSSNRLTDLTQRQWDQYIGPLIDEVDDYMDGLSGTPPLHVDFDAVNHREGFDRE